MLILQILGGIFLVVLLAAGFYGFKILRWYKRNVKDQVGNYEIYSLMPPIRFEMFKLAQANWRNGARQAADAEALKRLGFTPCGLYETQYGRTRTQFMIWKNGPGSALAMLYEAYTTVAELDEEICAYAAEFFVSFANGGSLAVGNNPHAGNLPRPQEDKCVYLEETDITTLFRALKTHIPAGTKLKAMPNPPKELLNFMQKYHGWLWEEPQLRSPELAQLFAPLGIEFNDELVADLLEYAQGEKAELLSEQVLERLAGASKMSAEQWEHYREKLVVVHDAMNAYQLSAALYELVKDPFEKDEAIIEALADKDPMTAPITQFEESLRQLSVANRIKQVAKLKLGVEARVYTMKPFK